MLRLLSSTSKGKVRPCGCSKLIGLVDTTALKSLFYSMGIMLPKEVIRSAEIKLISELTGDFKLASEPIVFVSMTSIRNGRLSQPFSWKHHGNRCARAC